MAALMNQYERLQRSHYDKISQVYQAHYDDVYSQRYRQRFFFNPMFFGIDLKGKNILDAMCGGGSTTQYLITRGACVAGLDISEQCIQLYRARWPGNPAVQASILKSSIPDATYDCVAIVGGLHHLHPHVDQAIREIHRMLKPGGYLCFVEPHQGSIFDQIRTRWYRHDPLFASNERAIDMEKEKSIFNSDFQYRAESYGGNIGYLLVLNSMIFRMPLWLKSWYSSFLLWVESVIGRVQGKSLSCFVVCQWQKR